VNLWGAPVVATSFPPPPPLFFFQSVSLFFSFRRGFQKKNPSLYVFGFLTLMAVPTLSFCGPPAPSLRVFEVDVHTTPRLCFSTPFFFLRLFFPLSTQQFFGSLFSSFFSFLPPTGVIYLFFVSFFAFRLGTPPPNQPTNPSGTLVFWTEWAFSVKKKNPFIVFSYGFCVLPPPGFSPPLLVWFLLFPLFSCVDPQAVGPSKDGVLPPLDLNFIMFAAFFFARFFPVFVRVLGGGFFNSLPPLWPTRQNPPMPLFFFCLFSSASDPIGCLQLPKNT